MTAAENYAHALRRWKRVRASITPAVTEEKLAREHLETLLDTVGPVHPSTNTAHQRWRAAREARRRAEVEVEAATYALDDAISAWASEAAQAWSAA